MIRFFGGRVMALANGIETQDIEVWTEGSKIAGLAFQADIPNGSKA